MNFFVSLFLWRRCSSLHRKEISLLQFITITLLHKLNAYDTKKSKLFREKIRGRTIFHLLLKKNQIWSMILFVDNFLELLNFRHLWGQRNHSRWRWSWSYSRLGYHQWRTEVKRRRAIFESFRWFGKEVSTWRKETQAGIRKSFPLDSPTLFISQYLKTIS